MKQIIIVVFMAALAGGVLYFQKAGLARQEQARAAEAEQRLRESEARALEKEQQNKLLEDKLRETHSEAATKAGEVQKLQQKLAESPKPSQAEPPGAKLFKDPQM